MIWKESTTSLYTSVFLSTVLHISAIVVGIVVNNNVLSVSFLNRSKADNNGTVSFRKLTNFKIFPKHGMVTLRAQVKITLILRKVFRLFLSALQPKHDGPV